MEIKCEFCGTWLNDTDEKCPNCGAPNGQLKRTADHTPKTIEELKQWYEDRHLPPAETTRFFIGVDYKKPRAFGIYEENGQYIVYKNKDDGNRAIRYKGKDQAYAVNELYLKLKSEILNQKAHQNNSGKSTSTPHVSAGAAAGSCLGTAGLGCGGLLFFIFGLCALCEEPLITIGLIVIAFTLMCIASFVVDKIYGKNTKKGKKVFNGTTYTICGIVFILVLILGWNAIDEGTPTYLSYDDNVYVRYEGDYYLYDNGDYSYINKDYLPSELVNNSSDYEFDSSSIEWNSDYSFMDSNYYEENLKPAESDWSSDSSDSSYDWDSGSSWDSGGTDFSSDW